MEEILSGLHHWVTPHPNHGLLVSSHYLKPARAVLDPLLPEDGGFDAIPGPVDHVVLSCRHHDRHHAEFVEHYGADFHVSEHGTHEYPGEDLVAYSTGQEVVPGVTAVANVPIAPDDTALLLDAADGALLFADSIIRDDDGEIGFFPDHLLGDDPERVRADITAAVAGLLDQPFDAVLFAHGEPIVRDGTAALREFVGDGR